MKIPSKLKIGGHVFKVVVGDCETMGQTNFNKSIITISDDLPKDQQESTLIHEIMHTLNTTWGAREHSLLDSLSEQIYQVLSDNKMLRK